MCYHTKMTMSVVPSPEEILRSRLWSTLPTVQLECLSPDIANNNPGISIDKFQVKVHRYGAIGQIYLAHSQQFDGRQISYIDNIWRLTPSKRRAKGAMLTSYLALAAYSEAKGETMHCGLCLSVHSRKIWEILAATGVAEITEPFKYHARGTYAFYTGAAYIKSSTEVAASELQQSYATENI